LLLLRDRKIGALLIEATQQAGGPTRPMATKKPPLKKPSTKKPAKPVVPAVVLSYDAVAQEELLPGGDRVRLTFRIVLSRRLAEALSAEAVRREMDLATLVTEVLGMTAAKALHG
jgi:hypothetical protein